MTALAPQANLIPRWVSLARMAVCVRHTRTGASRPPTPDQLQTEWHLRAAPVRIRVLPYTSQMGSKSTHLGVVSDPLFSCYFKGSQATRRAQKPNRNTLESAQNRPKRAKSAKSAKTPILTISRSTRIKMICYYAAFTTTAFQKWPFLARRCQK